MEMASKPRASVLNAGNTCTIVLVDVCNRPIMNLHRVPLYVTISDVKNKISDRLKEVGRNLPADLMILNFGENAQTVMEDTHPLTTYNTMSLSRIQVQIVRRVRFDIIVVVIKPETKCMCITKSKREELPFQVRVPSSCYMKQLRMEIARRMNCNVDRHELELFADAQLQELIAIEGTCRARGIAHESTVYTKFPLNFDLNNLAPLEIPRQPVDSDGKKADGETQAEPKPAEDILAASTDAEEEKAETKTALQLDFEKKAGVGKLLCSRASSSMIPPGYSPSAKDVALLPATVDYKAFQSFLTGALHAEDLAESFQEFFALFDTQAMGDLSAKQLCNITQMYGDEPLSKEEAEKFTKSVSCAVYSNCDDLTALNRMHGGVGAFSASLPFEYLQGLLLSPRMIMEQDSVLPIKVIVERQVICLNTYFIIIIISIIITVIMIVTNIKSSIIIHSIMSLNDDRHRAAFFFPAAQVDHWSKRWTVLVSRVVGSSAPVRRRGTSTVVRSIFGGPPCACTFGPLRLVFSYAFYVDVSGAWTELHAGFLLPTCGAPHSADLFSPPQKMLCYCPDPSCVVRCFSFLF
ncbi:hypothetical protein Esti_001593 [Eimeria stiedai]